MKGDRIKKHRRFHVLMRDWIHETCRPVDWPPFEIIEKVPDRQLAWTKAGTEREKEFLDAGFVKIVTVRKPFDMTVPVAQKCLDWASRGLR